MINLLLCGNNKVFDGILTQIISILNRTKEDLNLYIFTMDKSELRDDFLPIDDNQIEFLIEIIKQKSPKSNLTKIDVTDIYNKEFKDSKNENAYCTPYTLLRLLVDLIPNMPEKILYLDVDIMVGGDLNRLFDIDKEKYGCWLIRPDYINAGMLLINMKEAKKNKLFEKARNLIKNKKFVFADQDALFWATTRKKIISRIYNEQSRFDRKGTIICHFCKRLLWFPYPHTENFKQWNIEEVHKILKCHYYDKDLEEYLNLKKEFENRMRKVEIKV